MGRRGRQVSSLGAGRVWVPARTQHHDVAEVPAEEQADDGAQEPATGRAWHAGSSTQEAWQGPASWAEQAEPSWGAPARGLAVGDEVEGKVTTIATVGLFVDVGTARDGLLPWRNTCLKDADVRLGARLTGLCVERTDGGGGRLILRGPYTFGAPGDPWGAWRQGAWEQEPDDPWWPQQEWQEEPPGREAAAPDWGAGDGWERDGSWWQCAGASAAHESGGTFAGGSQAPQTNKDSGDGWQEASWWQSADAPVSDNWVAASESVPSAMHKGWEASDDVQHASDGQGGRGRDALVGDVFRLFDVDADGELSKAELRAFASKTGFDGTDADWDSEYALLCERWGTAGRPERGLPLAAFVEMVNDTTQDGCYCTEEELREMLQDAGKRDGHAAEWLGAAALPGAAPQQQQQQQPQQQQQQQQQLVAPPPGLVGPGAQPSSCSSDVVARQACAAGSSASAPRLLSRQDLKKQVFEALHSAWGGLPQRRCLLSQAMRFVAERSGFSGSDAEWAAEYEAVCRELGSSASQGVDEAMWCKLVDDESGSGCYHTDEELGDLLRELSKTPPGLGPVKPQVAAPPAAVESARKVDAPRSRAELKVAVFRHFDTDGDGRLRKAELKSFAAATGFDGTDSEWDAEYATLCAEVSCNPADGLDEVAFTGLVDDPSEGGCHCTDQELQTMLSAPAAKAPVQGQPKQPVASSKPAAPKLVATSFPPPMKAPPAGAGFGEPRAADPWAASFDPWATPAAKAAATKLKQAAAAQQAAAQESWGKWQEAGKPGPEADFSSRPAMDAQRLLEASRARLAAKKAAQEAVELPPGDDGAPGACPEQEPDAEKPQIVPEAEAAAEVVTRAPPKAPPATNKAPFAAPTKAPPVVPKAAPPPVPFEPRPPVPKAASTAAALATLGAAVARVAMGESRAVSAVLDSVDSAPCKAHVLAVASNAMRLLLQGRETEARTLLSLDHLAVHPVDGDVVLLQTVGSVARHVKPFAAPFLVRMLPAVFAKTEDKRNVVRSAATSAVDDIAYCSHPWAFDACLSAILPALDVKRSPAVKLQALHFLRLCSRANFGHDAVALKLPEVLPAVSGLVADTNSEVRTDAKATSEVLYRMCGNADLAPHLDDLLDCSRAGKDVTKCIADLAGAAFVRQVDPPALAVVLPVLVKGLRSRSPRTLGQVCAIVEKMCRLVSPAANVQPFLQQMLPLLRRVTDEASDPEVRDVAGRAHAFLAELADRDVDGNVRLQLRSALAVAEAALQDGGSGAGTSQQPFVVTPCPAPVRDVVLGYAVRIGAALAQCRVLDVQRWRDQLLPFLEPLFGKGGGGVDFQLLCDVAERLC